MSNEGETPEPSALEMLLAHAGLAAFPEDIRREVDALLATGQVPEPAARQRFVEAARRGTRQWALRQGAALETLLFEARRLRGDAAESLAETAGIAAEMMRSIERGELRIDAPGPGAVASWASALDLDRDLVADALRRSLGTRTSAPAYSGQPDIRLQPEQEQFIADVLRAFDDRVRDRPD